jgi:glycosyltransferase involved in cell wall biosynthesis
MQEMKKRRIVIASVLKPVDDTRMYEKLARSLTPISEVHVIGYPSVQKLPASPQLFIHPLPAFKRLSFKRFLMPIKIALKIQRLRPTHVIITTHELLGIVGWLWVLGISVIYDIQENYFRNVWHGKHNPFGIRHVLAFLIRAQEWRNAVLIKHFLLAEYVYVNQLPFVKSRFTVLENKTIAPTLPIQRRPIPQRGIHFLFTGTLSASTGVWEAIRLVDAFYALDPSIRLTIVGYCSLDADWIQLQTLQKTRPYLEVVGGSSLVPHGIVLQYIQQADVGLITYPPHPATAGKVPTKVYEYLAYQLPMLMRSTGLGTELCLHYDAGCVYNGIPIPTVYHQLSTHQFYPNPPTSAYWESQIPALKAVFE